MGNFLGIENDLWNIILGSIIVIETLILIVLTVITIRLQRKPSMGGRFDQNTKEIFLKLLEKVPTPLDLNNLPVISKEEAKKLEEIEKSLLFDFIDLAVLVKLGNIEYSQGNPTKALSNFQKACKESERQHNYGLQAVCLGNIGMIYSEMGNYDKALRYLGDSQRIRIEIGYKTGEADTLGSIGLIYKTIGKFDKALEYHEKALKIHRETEDKKGEANDLGNIGILYRHYNKVDKALKYHETALKIHREIEDKKGEAKDLLNIGIVYKSTGKSDRAIKTLEEALRINKAIGNKKEEANTLTNMGAMLYQKERDFDTSLKFLNDALKIHRNIGHKEGEAVTLGNIGLIYEKVGKTGTALRYLKEALMIIDKFQIFYIKDVFEKAFEELEIKSSK